MIANEIITKSTECEIMIEKIKDQGYSSATNMAGELASLQSRIKQTVPMAKNVSCIPIFCLN